MSSLHISFPSCCFQRWYSYNNVEFNIFPQGLKLHTSNKNVSTSSFVNFFTYCIGFNLTPIYPCTTWVLFWFEILFRLENPHNIYEGTDGVNVHRQDIGSQIPKW